VNHLANNKRRSVFSVGFVKIWFSNLIRPTTMAAIAFKGERADDLT
jgi:hypothetical protein